MTTDVRHHRIAWLREMIAENRRIVEEHERVSAEHGSDFASELSVRSMIAHREEMERELAELGGED